MSYLAGAGARDFGGASIASATDAGTGLGAVAL